MDKLSKQKLLAIFLLLWGAYFFFNAISGLVYELTYAGQYYSSAEIALDVLSDLAGLGIAAVLAVLGLKFLKPDKT